MTIYLDASTSSSSEELFDNFSEDEKSLSSFPIKLVAASEAQKYASTLFVSSIIFDELKEVSDYIQLEDNNSYFYKYEKDSSLKDGVVVIPLALFAKTSASRLYPVPFEKKVISDSKLACLFLKILSQETEDSQSNRNYPLITHNEIEQAFLASFHKHCFVLNQTLLIRIKQVVFKILIDEMEWINKSKKDLSMGFLSKKTSIKVNTENKFPNITKNPLNLNIPFLKCKVSLNDPYRQRQHLSPLYICYSEVIKAIQTNYANTAVYPRVMWQYPIDKRELKIQVETISDLLTGHVYGEFISSSLAQVKAAVAVSNDLSQIKAAIETSKDLPQCKATIEMSNSLKIELEPDTSLLTMGDGDICDASIIWITVSNIRAHNPLYKKGNIPLFFEDEILEALKANEEGLVWKGDPWTVQLKDRYSNVFTLDLSLNARDKNFRALHADQTALEKKYRICKDTQLVQDSISQTKIMIAKTRTAIPAKSIKVDVQVLLKPTNRVENLDAKLFKNYFREHVKEVLLREAFELCYEDHLYEFVVTEAGDTSSGASYHPSLLSIDENTKISFSTARMRLDEEGLVSFKISSKDKAISYQEDPKDYLKSLHIGGLSQEQLETLKTIKTKWDKKEVLLNMGLYPPAGILLHGPTGTGKSALSQAICRYLGVLPHNTQVVSCTDLLNRYIGQTEKNIRKLFDPVQKAVAAEGNQAKLHAIILDEFDSLFFNRNDASHSWEVTQIAQLLSIMDGPDKKSWLPVVVIANTNRLSSIDEALLRPRRFGDILKIGKPARKQIQEIFEIHTKKLKDKGNLEEGIDFALLAESCEGKTGANIQDLVAMAVSYAIQNMQKNGKDFKVTQEHFKRAIDQSIDRHNARLKPYKGTSLLYM